LLDQCVAWLKPRCGWALVTFAPHARQQHLPPTLRPTMSQPEMPDVKNLSKEDKEKMYSAASTVSPAAITGHHQEARELR